MQDYALYVGLGLLVIGGMWWAASRIKIDDVLPSEPPKQDDAAVVEKVLAVRELLKSCGDEGCKKLGDELLGALPHLLEGDSHA